MFSPKYHLTCYIICHVNARYNIDPSTVGRLEVGTETLVDKSKSTKTVLMDLFPGNTDVEGATIVNACYGGTAALLNAFAWCESRGWDGRYAIVVAADIAAYARGPARPTCGCGAVAVLVGRDAPLRFDPRHRATHGCNAWDFFKPDHTVEYPAVDGALSQLCYYRALEDCYERFARKMEQHQHQPFDCETPDYFVFHAPYNKLVQKSYARLFLCDARRRYAAEQAAAADDEEKKQESNCIGHNGKSMMMMNGVKGEYEDSGAAIAQLDLDYLTKPMEETYADRALDGVLKKLSAPAYRQRLADANAASQRVGNTYTASVFLGLASLIDRRGRGDGDGGGLAPGQSIVLFSYGSGALATMYRLQV